MNTTAQSRENWPVALVLLTGGVHLVSALWHILHGGMNTDEGFYAIAARSVWQGDLPYRDFGYTQMPLLPYINGLLMQITASDCSSSVRSTDFTAPSNSSWPPVGSV